MKGSSESGKMTDNRASKEARQTSIQTHKTENTKMSDFNKIDEAIAAANARRAAKNGGESHGSNQEKKGRKRLSAEEREARDRAREQEKAERQAAREAKKEAARQAREANKKPAHLTKVEKAAAKLPTLEYEANCLFESVTQTLSLNETAALAAHLEHFVREQRTKAALNSEVKVGQSVTIVSGDDPSLIGKTAVVTRAQRIRCYVSVPGHDKPVYLFTSDVQPLESVEQTQETDAVETEETVAVAS